MAAQGAFFLCAEAQDRVARSLIERVGFEFDAKAIPDLEGVPQHEILGPGIDGSSVPGWCDPGGADFDAAIIAIDVHEARAADHFFRAPLDGGEDYRFATLLLGQSFFDNALKVLQRVHAVREPLENIVDIILSNFPEYFGVAAAQRFEANYQPVQHDRRDNVQWR